VVERPQSRLAALQTMASHRPAQSCERLRNPASSPQVEKVGSRFLSLRQGGPTQYSPLPREGLGSPGTPTVFAQSSGLALACSGAERSLFGPASLKLWTALVYYGFAKALQGKALQASATGANSRVSLESRGNLRSNFAQSYGGEVPAPLGTSVSATSARSAAHFAQGAPSANPACVQLVRQIRSCPFSGTAPRPRPPTRRTRGVPLVGDCSSEKRLPSSALRLPIRAGSRWIRFQPT
jgi:hypothetical protein